MSTFLGINASHHGAICVVSDGWVEFYIEEERLGRIKRQEGATLALAQALRRFDRFDAVLYNATRTYQAPLNELLAALSRHPKTAAIPKISVAHHDAHAIGAAHTSPFAGSEMLVVVVDHSGEAFMGPGGQGDAYETESVYLASGGRFRPLYKRLGTNVHFPEFAQGMVEHLGKQSSGTQIVVQPFAGIAQCYGAVCTHLGYHHFEAGKVMGLAPYGRPSIKLMRDGHGDANMVAFDLPDRVGFHFNSLPHSMLSNGARQIVPEMDQFYFDLAASVQHDTMEAVADLIERHVVATGVRKVCFAGGYALNSICNTHLVKRMPGVELWPMPVAHDGGTAIGCAFAGYHVTGQPVPPIPMQTIFWGNAYEPETALAQFPQLDAQRIDDAPRRAAEMVSRGLTIAWHQGRSEAGPRALGNRSILSDPRKPDGRDHVNRLKGREWYRPLAGTILAEAYPEWFVEAGLSADFMMFVVACRHPQRIPAMVHVDGTCRVQTLTAQQNPRFHELIRHFRDLTGVPLVLNTSFNPAGEPLCETPEDSLRAFLKMPQLDTLFLEDYLVRRRES